MLNNNNFILWQSQLHRNCSNVVHPADLNITDNDTWCDWSPFGKIDSLLKIFCVLAYIISVLQLIHPCTHGDILIQYKISVFYCIVKYIWIFSSQSSVSRDPSEIILICWFGAQETFLIIIKWWKQLCCLYFCGNCDHFFRILWWINNLFEIKVFCWIINVFTFALYVLLLIEKKHLY